MKSAFSILFVTAAILGAVTFVAPAQAQDTSWDVNKSAAEKALSDARAEAKRLADEIRALNADIDEQKTVQKDFWKDRRGAALIREWNYPAGMTSAAEKAEFRGRTEARYLRMGEKISDLEKELKDKRSAYDAKMNEQAKQGGVLAELNKKILAGEEAAKAKEREIESLKLKYAKLEVDAKFDQDKFNLLSAKQKLEVLQDRFDNAMVGEYMKEKFERFVNSDQGLCNAIGKCENGIREKSAPIKLDFMFNGKFSADDATNSSTVARPKTSALK